MFLNLNLFFPNISSVYASFKKWFSLQVTLPVCDKKLSSHSCQGQILMIYNNIITYWKFEDPHYSEHTPTSWFPRLLQFNSSLIANLWIWSGYYIYTQQRNTQLGLSYQKRKITYYSFLEKVFLLLRCDYFNSTFFILVCFRRIFCMKQNMTWHHKFKCLVDIEFYKTFSSDLVRVSPTQYSSMRPKTSRLFRWPQRKVPNPSQQF